jgi:hypothetical protein
VDSIKGANSAAGNKQTITQMLRKKISQPNLRKLNKSKSREDLAAGNKKSKSREDLAADYKTKRKALTKKPSMPNMEAIIRNFKSMGKSGGSG